MSLNLKEILHELAGVVGREWMHADIDALPMKGVEDRGETQAEKDAKGSPLSEDEKHTLAALQARANPQPESRKSDEPEHGELLGEKVKAGQEGGPVNG